MLFHIVKSGVITLLLSVFVISSVLSVEANEFSTSPQLKQGQKVRLGYLEGGPFLNYPPNLISFVQGLVKLGWLEDPHFPHFADQTDAKTVWEWLVTHTRSDYLVFVKDGFYSNNWDKILREEVKPQILNRLGDNPDFDFMVAMGTWAGQDLADEQNRVATMVFSASDPIRAKIVKHAQRSGIPHLHARVDPTRYERQVRLFHDIMGFKTLGVAYENSSEGRTYAAIEDIRKVALEKNFKVAECFTLNGTPDLDAANASVRKCHQELAETVDALYITNQTGINAENMPELMAPLLAKKIPTFSQPGAKMVKHGALMSIAQAGFKFVGEFHARAAGQIFNGAQPGDLSQLFEDPPKLSLNLETARRVGYTPSLEIMVAADEIYHEISVAD
jgi:ABC-type uncharacterized transport system substrate-binding protein